MTSDFFYQAKYRFISLAVMLCALFAIVMRANGQAVPPQRTLKIISYNIHHGNPPSAADSVIDLPGLAKVINDADPDLVALQEVDVNNSRSGMELNEAKELGRLTGMHAYFTKAIDFSGGAYGDAVLSRFEILDSMRYELPVTMQTRGETRSICVIKVALPHGKKMLFASTHLDYLSVAENRLLQASVLGNIIQTFSLPVVLAGDFNAEPDSPTMTKLDEIFSRTCMGNCPPTFSSSQPERTIDYVLYRPSEAFEPLQVRTIRSARGSDHLPLVARIKLK